MRFITVLFLLLAHFSHAAEKPNILFIVVDDLGYGDLSSYGATDLKSPHLDALLADGIRFTEFYANCPVCSPTRASLLTGCYPDLVGVPGVVRTKPEDNWGFLSRSATLLPQVLKKSGYTTAAIGKWHLGLDAPEHPNARGFEHFHGFLGDMMDDYYHHRRHNQNYMRLNGETITPEGHATDLFTDWTNDYLTAHSTKDDPKPFFLYLAYNAPHTPIQPPADWLAKVKAREKGITEKRAKLVALIEHMDEGIGRVIATLKKNNQWDNTLILFVSDNGGQVNVGANCGNLRGEKQDMYEGGIKVPAGATWPGVIKPGTSDFQALTMDLFATAIDAAGGDSPAKIDGSTILPLLKSGSQPAFKRDLFWVRREGNLRYMGETSWAMRRGPWKLVKNSPMQPWELFNLEKDPLETTDLATSNRPEFNELATGMRAYIQRGGSVPWQQAD
ncbi:MAG: sulfatase-like hydrolase/transferase [Akkermansiaceae bacterium]|jgi:arylsulfatase A-like enzyme